MTSLTHVEGNLQVISLNKNKVLTCTGSSHWLKGLTLISAINLLVILEVCILFLLTHMYSQENFCFISFTGFSLFTFRSCTYIIKYKKNHEAMSILIWVLLTYFCTLEFGGEVLLPFFFYFASWWKTPVKMSVTCHWTDVKHHHLHIYCSKVGKPANVGHFHTLTCQLWLKIHHWELLSWELSVFGLSRDFVFLLRN